MDDLNNTAPAVDEAAQPEAVESTRDIIAAAVARQKEAATTGDAPEAPKPAIDRARDEAGRFKAGETGEKPLDRAGDRPDPAKADVRPDAKPEPEAKPQQAEAPFRSPPGFSPQTKQFLATAPEFLKADLAKRESEINNGLAKLADYKGLDSLADEARRSGTTLAQAFQNYRSAEVALQRDFTGGIAQLCQFYNVHPMQLAQQLAGKFGGQGSGQAQQPAQQQASIPPQLMQEIQGIKQQLASERQAQTATVVEKFFSDPANIYAENVADQMAELISAARARGQSIDLKQAYESACWSNPEIRTLLINEQMQKSAASAAAPGKQQVASQAKAAAKAISGAPAGGKPAATPAPTTDRREIIRQAIEAARSHA